MSKEEEKGLRKEDLLHDGFQDNLEPLEPLDLGKCKTVNDLVKAMSKTAFQGRNLGEAVDVLEAMIKDKDCFVVLTLSGAMTPAKMGLIICDLIDHGMVNAIISTGALITHGFVEAQGMAHFKYKFGEMNDRELYYKGYDRIYDIIELEKNLDDTEDIIKDIIGKEDADIPLHSAKVTMLLGKYLHENIKGRGILKSAYEKNVPVFIPAFTDSELGLDIGVLNARRRMDGKKEFTFNSFADLEEFSKLILKSKTLGIFTVGGGVPRNWAQQTAPYLDILNKRLNLNQDDLYFKRYKYAVRICPEPSFWGGLSGCTYSEGVSWGKIMPKEEGGMHAEVLCDATIALPIVVKAVMERLGIK